MSEQPMLQVRDLKLHFPTDEGAVRALESVSFNVNESEIFGLVGESGSGKSVSSLSIIGLSSGKLDNGQIFFEGEDLTSVPEKRLRELRGNEISMIFQEPMTALNPLYSVEKQIHEVMLLHGKLPPVEMSFIERMYASMRAKVSRPFTKIASICKDPKSYRPSANDIMTVAILYGAWVLFRSAPIFSSFLAGFFLLTWILSSLNSIDHAHSSVIVERLREVQIPKPEAVAKMFPHELSGGMRQRVMIAMMMACEPKLLIADEPTTALDVTIQSQIVHLMKDLRDRRGTAVLLITHDIGLVADMCERVGVMYAGSIVEQGSIEQILTSPRMPYTVGLMHSIPRIGDGRDTLPIIPGQVPDPINLPSGCRFHPRCPFADDLCSSETPPSVDLGDGHLASCHHLGKTEVMSEVQDAFDRFVTKLDSAGGTPND
ncbi:MAG TPA: ABC transporter ATP-binding protein [Candidatus Thalassarchaeaceae archaeon]|nr:ABC transporter ATP-binding protein [Candidatus Thalassarchaeaceae archaeon]